MIKSKMLGPVYKYNIPYKMASEYMYKTKLIGWRTKGEKKREKPVRISL